MTAAPSHVLSPSILYSTVCTWYHGVGGDRWGVGIGGGLGGGTDGD
jgi:hypothetical protein